MPVRDATREDLAAIEELLAAARLPLAGVENKIGRLWVVLDDRGVKGTAGVERHGSEGLLRSVVVAPGHRGRGVGRELCTAAEARARAVGIRRLYLLTIDAESFFVRLGYETLSRDAAPAGIASSDEFRILCPESAVFMSKRL